jgi:hypothetical protein
MFPMMVPVTSSTKTQELAKQLLRTLIDSEAGFPDCVDALVCTICALAATSANDTPDLVHSLSGDIGALIDANRRKQAELDKAN